MKNKLLRLALIAGILSIVSCSTDTFVQDSLDVDSDLSTIESITMLPLGSDLYFTLTSAGSWSLENSDSWIKCSTSGGKEGTYLINISSDVNRSGQNRVGHLSLSSNGVSKKISVYQDCPYLRLKVNDDDNKLDFKWNDSKESGAKGYTFTIESNVNWKINMTDESGNFALSNNKGAGNASISFFAKKNNIDKDSYIASLDLAAYQDDDCSQKIGEGVDSYSLSANQDNLKFLINGGCDDITVSVDELNKVVRGGALFIDSELPWKLKENLEWVSMSSESGPGDTLTVKVCADGVNPSLNERTKDVVLLSDGGAERIIHVVQDPYVFQLDTYVLKIGNNDLSERTVSVTTSGGWEITSVPDWMSVSPTSGEGNTTVSVSCKDRNYLEVDNVCDLQFKSTLNSLTREATVSQDKFVLAINPDATIGKIPAFSTLKYDAGILCSGDWSISSDASWVGISTSGGSGDSSVTVGATTVNPDEGKDRSGTITLVSETHKAKGLILKKTIPIVQTRFLFSLESSTSTLDAYSPGTALTLKITCSGSWKITDCPSWLKPQTTSGQFDMDLPVKCDANTSKTAKRSGVITVMCTDKSRTEKTGTITQDLFVFDLSSSTLSSIPPVGTSDWKTTLHCSKNVKWTISDYSWCGYQGSSSGTGEKEFKFKPENNLSTSSRTNVVKVTNDLTGEILNLTFSQSPFVFDVSPLTDYKIGELDVLDKYININCSERWTIVCDKDWVEFDTKTGSGTGMPKFHVGKNYKTEARKATVTVYSNLQRGTSSELKKTFTIDQQEYLFDGKQESCSFKALTTGGNPQTYKSSVTCSGNWKITNVPDWLSVTPTSGNGDPEGKTEEITITPSNNYFSTKRQVDIYVVSEDNSDLKKKIAVTQEAMTFEVGRTKVSFEKGGGAETCNITCPVAWTATASQGWISVSPSSGEGNGTIEIKVEKNSGSAREGEVVVKCSQSGETKKIIVSQAKK